MKRSIPNSKKRETFTLGNITFESHIIKIIGRAFNNVSCLKLSVDGY